MAAHGFPLVPILTLRHAEGKTSAIGHVNATEM